MIVVFAGRRAQTLPGDHRDLALRLQRLLAGLKPRALVGAAADGGDLLVLEAALSESAPPQIHLVLPTSPEVFVASSVAEEWRERHRRVLDRILNLGGTVESLELPDGAEAYRAANLRMLERATLLAEGGDVPDERAITLLVAAEGEGAMVNDLAQGAQLRALPILRIDPTVDLSTRPSCFVAMPYGRKLDTQRSVELNCELLYGRVLVPALEHAQLRYRRADEEIDSGVVLVPMIEWLAEADLVIGDLATANFNVGWELGLRHLLRSSKTLLMLPRGTRPPFDLSALRHVGYGLDEAGIGEGDIVAAWQALAPHLTGLDGSQHNDSPVATVMDVQSWAKVSSREERDERFETMRDRLALARDLRDADSMRAVAAEADSLSREAARVLRAEAGVGLVRLGRYRDAAQLLGPLVAADEEVRRPEAHVSYAQALYRGDDATVAEYDAAEQVLRNLLLRRPGHPEVWAGLGAIAKRRSRQRRAPALQADDLRLALEAYAHDYERDLDLYYEGVNLVACAMVLERVHGDEAAGRRGRRVLDAVRLASRLSLERDRREFWAAVSVAELDMHAVLLGASTDAAAPVAGYAHARSLSPSPGDLHSSLSQFGWLEDVGVADPLLGRSRAALEGKPSSG